jgi:type IV fimbrial biogenesis protein FimT
MNTSSGARRGIECRSRRLWVTSKGFTLIELMITLAIVVILTTLGTAAFTRIIAENRMATAVNDFVSTLQLARSEAVKRGIEVTVCVSADNATCNEDSDAWDGGYVVIADLDGTEEELLRVQAAKPLVQVTAQVDRFTYDTDGSVPDAELHFADEGGRADCRVVTVSAVGYVSTAKENDAICDDFPE